MNALKLIIGFILSLIGFFPLIISLSSKESDPLPIIVSLLILSIGIIFIVSYFNEKNRLSETEKRSKEIENLKMENERLKSLLNK